MSQTTATSEFNSNRWYQILLSNETLAFTGTPRWDGYSYGSMMTNVQNRTEFEQQWQVYPFNSTFFVLRTRASGPDNYLRVMLSVDGEGLPIPKPRMVNPMLPDVSWLWAMGKWADGSFYLWNAENGTNWHLNTTVLPSGHTEMVSLNPQPKQGQAFTFKELGEINNQTFSTINVRDEDLVLSGESGESEGWRRLTRTVYLDSSVAGQSNVVNGTWRVFPVPYTHKPGR
ncbi:uncharacterized protein J3D65DRAFT_673499 [Phyllosticta citribraziliensis]|uniref:Uncharacterized protein n=1 Tax=Phyllosticta citribraziliensis TaxID=989973 RepID=A0ABR1MA77_9PEZI